MKKLGIQDDSISIAQVARLALQMPIKDVKYAILDVADLSDDPGLIPLLGNLCQDAEPLIAMYAARALARKGTPLLLGPFQQCLRLIEMFYPEEALEALVELNAVEGAGLLIDALSHQRIDVREWVGQALIALTGEDFGWDTALWEAWWRDRKAA